MVTAWLSAQRERAEPSDSTLEKKTGAENSEKGGSHPGGGKLLFQYVLTLGNKKSVVGLFGAVLFERFV